MTTLEQVKTWAWLMKELNKIPDYNTRVAMREDLRRKALRDWGWVPGESTPFSEEKAPELDSWEEEFYEDMKDSEEFRVDVRKDKRKTTLNETRMNIRQFIREGGDYTEIPEDIRTPEFQELFCEEIRKYGEDAIESYKAVTKNNK